MSKAKLLLFGSACLVVATIVYLDSLTRPQQIPSAVGRSAVSDDEDASGDVSADPDVPLSPMDEYRVTLNQAEQYLQSVDGYTATFVRQIRKGDDLLDRDEISIKIRHQPFSVYMIWNEDGQQVLYVAGENDGKLLARRTRGFFRGTIKLAPTSQIAMHDSRYPIHELGLLGLVENAQDVMAACWSHSGVDYAVETVNLDGQPVRQFTVTFDSPDVQDTYSRCIFCFSEGDPMPIWITSNGWTEQGAPGELLEHYHYRDLRINPGLTELDFDSENEAYGL